MKLLLVPFVLAQLAVFSHAEPTPYPRLQNTVTKLYLETLDSPPRPWKAVGTPNPGPNQRWQPYPVPGGFGIKNLGTQTFLSYPSSISEGTQVFSVNQGSPSFKIAWRFVQNGSDIKIQTTTEPPACVVQSPDGVTTLTLKLEECQTWVFIR
jgi:hypothetical protein